MRLRLRLGIAVVTITLLAGCASPGDERLVPANMPELKEALGLARDPTPPLAKAVANATIVGVGSPVRFTAEGTSDPQGLPLAYRWAFGDGATADGPEVAHAYAAPGEYDARLTVTNAGGAADHAVVTVQVLAKDLPPVATARVTDASGRPTLDTERGAPLTFDATESRDPEGAPLSFHWDFGDGSTAHEPRTQHAFDAPGAHKVSLVVRDAGGRSSAWHGMVCVSASWEKRGTLDLLKTWDALTVTMRPGLEGFTATLSFEGSLGANDLTLMVKAPDQREVARSAGPTPPGAQGTQTRTVTVDPSMLAAAEAGEWTLEVQRQTTGPTGAPYALAARAAC